MAEYDASDEQLPGEVIEQMRAEIERLRFLIAWRNDTEFDALPDMNAYNAFQDWLEARLGVSRHVDVAYADLDSELDAIADAVVGEYLKAEGASSGK